MTEEDINLEVIKVPVPETKLVEPLKNLPGTSAVWQLLT